jgi:N-acetylmuramoyl-L-alanine amidase
LTALGHGCEPDEPGTYGEATTRAVTALQTVRGLRADGVCGSQTWAAVVEAGYRLGDRRLYQRKPMMRGDDVADLQRRLGALGFDAGKVDGIFGPDTAGALADFQRNAGITVDGIFGPDELQVLERLGHRGDGLVAEVRERAALRWSARTLDGLRVVIAERGGLDALSSSIGRLLRRHGADALVLHHPDGSELAQQGNAAGARVFLEVASLGEAEGCRCAYYRGYSTTSPAGQDLAERLQATVPGVLGVAALGAAGMAIPVLRETRMPAVVCEAGPTRLLVARAPVFAAAVVDALSAWVACPTDAGAPPSG